jgi:hypothetical protein
MQIELTAASSASRTRRLRVENAGLRDDLAVAYGQQRARRDDGALPR